VETHPGVVIGVNGVHVYTVSTVVYISATYVETLEAQTYVT
jgi:hypothetical protein